MIELKKTPDETEVGYVYRICSNKDSIGSWEDVANILNEELGHNYGESKYRKDYATFQKMYEGNMDRFNASNYIEDMRRAKEDLQRERYKMQAEKMEYMRNLREEARDDLIIERLENAIGNLEPIVVPPKIKRLKDIRRDFVLIFGDEHYGAEFDIKGADGKTINKYSPDIFEERMWRMLDNVIEIIEKENINELNVFSVGDFADGVLRIGQLMKLRYGVVDSTVKYMEFLANWLNELTRFCRVKFYMVDGNHTEIRMFNQPKGAFKDENMGKIVRHYLGARLRDNPNIVLADFSDSVCHTVIAGYNVVCVHGEQKSMEATLKDLSMVYGIDIDYLISGHMHHSEYVSVGIDKGVIRCPSIIGADPYSMSINRASNPSALLCVFEEGRGKTIDYTIDLK